MILKKKWEVTFLSFVEIKYEKEEGWSLSF